MYNIIIFTDQFLLLLNINQVENNVQSEITENINGNLKQESTNLSVKYTKEFCALSEGYLKTNAIYNSIIQYL